MKGIVLAGGSGTRLYPITLAISKQLVPVYDKPMIYYPLSTLISAGINDILIISTPQDLPRFEQLLGSGERLGCTFTYMVQDSPRGLADAFIIGADFIGQDPVAMILGDNIFHVSADLSQFTHPDGGIIFGYPVSDPERYGVIEFDKDRRVHSIVEKPSKPKSNFAQTGLYFYDNEIVKFARQIKPSARGEIEITDINNLYLKQGRLKVHILDRGSAWLDTGTFQSLNQASQYVQVIEERTGLKLGCIEEAAYKQGFIDASQLEKIASELIKSGYGKYLIEMIKETKN